MVKPVILCVDDEKTVLNSLRQELEYSLDARYTLELAESGEEGLEILQELLDTGYEVHVVISDQLMPGMKGDQFLTEVHRIAPDIRKILLTGQANAESVGNAVNRAGLYRYIAKPWEETDLRITVQQAAESFLLNQQLAVQVKIMSDLNRNAKFLSEATDPHEVARRFLQAAMADTLAPRGLFYFHPEGSEPLWLQGTAIGGEVRVLALEADAARQLFPEAILLKANSDGHPLIAHNVAQQPEWKALLKGYSATVTAVYAAPIRHQDNLLGALYLEHPSETRFFTPDRQQFLSLLAAQAGTCLDNALLYLNLERKVQERTRIIADKNQQITDSIEYARRIQLAILPRTDTLGHISPEHFILYQPKDIVSGDFYWFAEQDGAQLIAAVDCTGHGVPGAFMSVLGNNLLSQIVKEQGTTEPEAILNRLHQQVRAALKQYDENATIQDGMDIALVRFNTVANTLTFSAAKRPALLLSAAGTSQELKPDRQAIGGSVYGLEEGARFGQQDYPWLPGDTLYLFTDGYADQFGGPDGRRYSTRRFSDLLHAVAPAPMPQQKQKLLDELRTWQGRRPQTDDILVMGVRRPS